MRNGVKRQSSLSAFVSNRNGSHNILMYDLQQQQLIYLPRWRGTAESPSLADAIAYIASDQGKPTLVLRDRATQQSQVLSQWYWVRNQY